MKCSSRSRHPNFCAKRRTRQRRDQKTLIYRRRGDRKMPASLRSGVSDLAELNASAQREHPSLGRVNHNTAERRARRQRAQKMRIYPRRGVREASTHLRSGGSGVSALIAPARGEYAPARRVSQDPALKRAQDDGELRNRAYIHGWVLVKESG